MRKRDWVLEIIGTVLFFALMYALIFFFALFGPL